MQNPGKSVYAEYEQVYTVCACHLNLLQIVAQCAQELYHLMTNTPFCLTNLQLITEKQYGISKKQLFCQADPKFTKLSEDQVKYVGRNCFALV